MKKKNKRVTIFDLAAYLGVSRGTISRAFNDQEGINAQTRDRVLKAARKIGYQPHNGARMMKLTRKRRWGLLLPHLRNPYYAELVEALNKEARARRTTLLLGLSLEENESQVMIEQWISGETDGLIMDQSYYRQNPKYFDQLRERGQQMVFLHGKPIPGFDFVRYDLYGSFSRNLRTLTALGHTRIGFVGQDFDGCRNTGRFRAYSDFHAQNGWPLREELTFFGEDGHVGGLSAWAYFSGMPEPPTAVVCGDDIIACGLIQGVRSQGLEIPGHISVSGVDNIAEAERLGLTTIRTDREETSRAILSILERRIADPDLPPQVATIPSSLILRDSEGAPRTCPLPSLSRD